jgi:hypothetical protein
VWLVGGQHWQTGWIDIGGRRIRCVIEVQGYKDDRHRRSRAEVDVARFGFREAWLIDERSRKEYLNDVGYSPNTSGGQDLTSGFGILGYLLGTS